MELGQTPRIHVFLGKVQKIGKVWSLPNRENLMIENSVKFLQT